MKTQNLMLPVLIGLVVGFIAGFLAQKSLSPCVQLPVMSVQTDTVMTTDTLRDTVLTPQIRTIIRWDTMRLEIKPADSTKSQNGNTLPPDTTYRDAEPRIDSGGNLSIPITRKVYKTEDYRAEVEGYRPSLVSMEIYRRNMEITREVTKVKRPWLAVTAGGSAGYIDKQVKFMPAITAGIVLWSK